MELLYSTNGADLFQIPWTKEQLTGSKNLERGKEEVSGRREEEMISSAIFGAAAGTGLALVVAMTIVVYRYYAVKRKGKYWSNLDRWPDPPSTSKPEVRHQNCPQHCHDDSSSHVLNCWRKPQKNYYAVQTGVSGTIHVNSFVHSTAASNSRDTG